MTLSKNTQNSLLTSYYSILIFLCCADVFFSTRIHNYNFRLGQLFLLFNLAYVLFQGLKDDSLFPSLKPAFSILKNWLPFFFFYGLAAVLSPNPIPTFLKLAWFIFNVSGAVILFFTAKHFLPLKRSVLYAVGLVSFFIWLEFILVYWFGCFDWFAFLETHPANEIPWFRSLLGYAQNAPGDADIPIIYRPNAFYYEPSYAGAALSLAFPLCLAAVFIKNKFSWKVLWFSVVILGAVIITNSRTGILAISFGLLIMTSLSFYKDKQLFQTIYKTLLVLVVIFGVCLLFPGVRSYGRFYEKIFEPNSLASRLSDPNSSEGWRVANTMRSLRLIQENPILGIGVPPLTPQHGLLGLGQTSQSMWAEILVESGFLGFFAFLYGVGKTLYDATRRKNKIYLLILVTAAFIPHCIVSMNFTSTFPRLDYWLFFFFALRLMWEDKMGDIR